MAHPREYPSEISAATGEAVERSDAAIRELLKSAPRSFWKEVRQFPSSPPRPVEVARG